MNHYKYTYTISAIIILIGVLPIFSMFLHPVYLVDDGTAYRIGLRAAINNNEKAILNLEDVINEGVYNQRKILESKHQMEAAYSMLNYMRAEHLLGARWKYRFYAVLTILVGVILCWAARNNQRKHRCPKDPQN